MNCFRRTVSLLTFALAIQSTSAAWPEEPKAKVEVILTGLTNPCGVAIQPETAAVFVSDTGAGQVVKFSPEAANKSTPVITGFPQAVNSKELTYGIGPLGLVFADQNTLVTGEGALKQGDEVIRVFELSAQDKPLSYNDAKQKIGLLYGGESKAKGAGNFFALALTPTALFVTAHGTDEKGWVLKADVKNNHTIDELLPFIQFKAETKIDALVGITVSKQGFVVLGPRINKDKSTNDVHPRRSLLAFNNAKTGNLLMSLPTTLHDITGLAYSPKSGRLYALDFGWDDPSQCGLYRLDAATVDGRPEVKAVRITSLDKPSALTFAPDNTLYVTEFGSIPKEPKTEKTLKPGKLIKITGDL